jgi:hypothetical protein
MTFIHLDGNVENTCVLSDFEQSMIHKAQLEHGRIYPCANKPSFEECFTVDNGMHLFWFNTEDKSTHVITAKA